MALSAANSGNRVTKWTSEVYREWLRGNRFSRFMGKSANNVIHVREDLTKSKGDRISFPFIRQLTQAAVTGSGTMAGNEEALVNYAHLLTVNKRRNAVVVPESEAIKTEFDLFDEAKLMLQSWLKDDTRDLIISALLSAKIDGVTAYADCSAAERNAWAVANSDRVLYGSVKGNYSGVHATDLGKIDTTSDKLDKELVSLMRRMATTASPAIMPIRESEDEEWFVLFCTSRAFRDLKLDLASTLASADIRGMSESAKGNALFRPGDLVWDGVIVREVPEIPVLTGVGDTASDVSPIFLCGAQAVALGYAKKPTPVAEDFDYGDKMGAEVHYIVGVEKLMSNSVQNGVVTAFVSTTADA